MAAITTRASVAALHLQLIQLLEVSGVTDDADLADLTVNVNFRVARVDVAKLSPDGLHIGEWLCGFSINPSNLATFGTPVGLPGTDERTH